MKKGSQQATKPPTTTARVPAVLVSRVTLLMQLCWWPRSVPARATRLQGLPASGASAGTARPTVVGRGSVGPPASLVVPSETEAAESRVDRIARVPGFVGPLDGSGVCNRVAQSLGRAAGGVCKES